MQSLWWQIFDVLGTVAFALSGVLVAISRRMDIFGVFVLSAATAVGGGIIRDIILGEIPPSAFRTSMYFWLIISTLCLASISVRYINSGKWQHMMRYSIHFYLICDAVGLGSFTVTGTLLGCYLYPQYWTLAITLGVLTAVGGGVIRDVLAGRIPGVFKKDIYATASLSGAVVLYLLFISLEMSLNAAAVIGFIFTVAIRLVAVFFHLNLPRVKRKRREQFF
ncbi:membrane protein [Megasphaera cerevisiae DSM 20462]|jgi:uncharacterized membrane protein YeiH|uniref:Membrane protein n=1 Tax=Megasphaera cerevisiae DSM 20462 TaxID=1122219 RepID=A0A0J6WW80_9FIRM|nr:trimeric intracellular cation channel family protein [Megasphaera cerevisiae]KMO86047.1 membrane protein [Megasphaera cerevisiae DSM 20462]OKY52466.1 hypothetical protein BSR42_12675 [Megasphaera cerevisiae]SKA03942.1 Uncharacterized membrane protein YeiH [Megasphaera cerevisiae DSM 20462]